MMTSSLKLTFGALLLSAVTVACSSPSGEAPSQDGVSADTAASAHAQFPQSEPDMDGPMFLAFRAAGGAAKKLPAQSGTWLLQNVQTQKQFTQYRFIFQLNVVDDHGTVGCEAIDVTIDTGATDANIKAVKTEKLPRVGSDALCK